MQPQTNGRVTGHLLRLDRARGPVFYAHYRDRGGKQRTRMLGDVFTGKGRPPAGAFTEKMAQEALEAILTDERREDTTAAPSGVTFREAAEEFVRYHEDVRHTDPKSVRDYKTAINRRLVPEFGDQLLEAITPNDVDRFKERMIAGEFSPRPPAPRTVIRHLVVMSGVYQRAKRAYGITTNPASAELVERPTLKYTGEFVTYNHTQMIELVNAASNKQDAVIFTVAAFSGLRQGELLALTWRDVDFINNLLHVRRNYTDGTLKIPKGKRVRSVPMTTEVVTALAKLKERGHLDRDADLVFVSDTGTHLDHYQLRRRFWEAQIRADLPKIRFHDLRHHFGSQLIRKLDAHTVQAMMGHAHYSTTQRYLHHQPRPDDAAKMREAFGYTDTVRTPQPQEA